MASVVGRGGGCVATMGIAACGVSVTEPIGAGAVSTLDAAGPAPDEEAAAPPDSLNDGLVAYWKLDEDDGTVAVVDSSGNGHDGVAINAPLPSTMVPPVKFRDPLSRGFDGTKQYVLI